MAEMTIDVDGYAATLAERDELLRSAQGLIAAAENVIAEARTTIGKHGGRHVETPGTRDARIRYTASLEALRASVTRAVERTAQ